MRQQAHGQTITGMDAMLKALCVKMGVVTAPAQEVETPVEATLPAGGSGDGSQVTTEADRRRPPSDLEAKEEEAITGNEKSAAKKIKGADQKDEL